MDIYLIVIFCLALLFVFLIVYFLVRRLGIKEFHLSFKEGLSFTKKDIPELNLSIGNYLGIIVSQDGQIRKIHVNLIIKSNIDQVIDNFNLILDKRIKFRVKQFYIEDRTVGIRQPDQTIELPLSLEKDKSLNLKAEFETFQYSVFDLSIGVHNLKLYFKTHNQEALKKFKINFSESNMRALELAKREAISDRQAKIINIPIIFI